MKKSNNGFRKYKSHKVVEAAQILSMEYLGNLEGFVAIHTTLDKGLIRVSRSWCQRHEPEEGGYVVRYEDGYMSYSPQKAFEKGYSQIEETPLNISEGVQRAYNNAKSKGFYNKPQEIGTALALIHSEVSEALEASLIDKRADMVKHETDTRPFMLSFHEHIKDSFEDEMADIVIRVFSLCGHLGIDLERHIELKMQFNEGRERLHGIRYGRLEDKDE